MGAIFSFFTQGVTLGFSAAASPGPFQAFLFTSASRVGVWRTLPLALAPLVSDGPIVAVILLALTGMPRGFLRGLEVAGGVFLVWLAWGAFRTAGDAHGQSSRPPEGAAGSFLRAAV